MPKKLNISFEQAMLAVAAVAVGYIAWEIYQTTSARKQRDEMVLDVAGVISDPNYWQGAGGEHFVPADAHIGAPVTMPHRYPVASGTNISTLIAKGFNPLLRPAPTDYDYLIQPPSEGSF